jgi:integrase
LDTCREVRKFEQCHPLGTIPNLTLRILLYTGARRDDARRLGDQHIKNGFLEFQPMKTRATTGVVVTLPILPPLQEAIEAMRTEDMVWITSSLKIPFKSSASFGEWFRSKCVKAGVPGRAHGLRKAGATLAAENRATGAQLMAIYGWTTVGQTEVYTRAADRKKLAFEGAKLLLRKDN